jgi:selenocysteine lyase/cysteine desulfurase
VDYIALFQRAWTPCTKVLFFSAPTYNAGAMLPIRSLVRLAEAHAAVNLADAAHIMPGVVCCNLHQLGADCGHVPERLSISRRRNCS